MTKKEFDFKEKKVDSGSLFVTRNRQLHGYFGKSKRRPFTPEQQEWINDLKDFLEQVELHQQGKIKLKSADELLDELTRL